jgi:hypothetical protein
MKNWKPFTLLFWVTLLPPALGQRRSIETTPESEHPVCTPFAEAKKQIGKKQCISGREIRVDRSPTGMTFLDFCEDYRVCSFTVVIFPDDLHHMGNLNQLVGKTVEVSGRVKDYDGRAEIMLQDEKQLGGEVKKLPPVLRSLTSNREASFPLVHFTPRKTAKPATKKRRYRRPSMSKKAAISKA